MKLSIFVCTGVTVNAQIIEDSQSTWTDWTSWSSCSRSCGGGIRTRLKACENEGLGFCPGLTGLSDEDSCNEAQCPTWSNWGVWNECSSNCGGGIQTKTRTCLNGEEGDCSGSALNEQQCNRHSCEPGMVYWVGMKGYGASWSLVREEYLPFGATALDRCVSYCLNNDGCLATAVWGRKKRDETLYKYTCFIASQAFYTPYNGPYLLEHEYQIYGQEIVTVALTEDYYESVKSNPHVRSPDGYIKGMVEDAICDETQTGFGVVKYRDTERTKFSSADPKYIIQETGSTADDCAIKCFETAGCTTFFAEDDQCNFVIGNPQRGAVSDEVLASGRLSNSCPSSAFTNTFTKRSQLWCLIFTPNEADALVDNIVAINTGNPDTPINQWSFKTKSENPFITSSQIVSVSAPDLYGSDRRYRPIRFSIETHVRVGNNQATRKRRSDDLLADIEAIEQQAISFITDGGLELPSEAQVAVTGPVETVEFVQTAADGSIAADCSSGSCQCSSGFIDNGNGCQEMIEEQAATTEAPTTTTTATTSISVQDWISSLLDKMEAVLDDSRPGRPRKALLSKWTHQGEKFVQRYETIVANGCDTPDTYEDASIDFASVNGCSDINAIEAAFGTWGEQFTYDCKKERRGTHAKWFNRNIQHVKRVASRTRKILKC